MKVDIPELINGFRKADAAEIMQQVERVLLFPRAKRQPSGNCCKIRICLLFPCRPWRRLLTNEELNYVRITNRTDLVSRLGPMFGLMATLIPLGPGLTALGEGDPRVLADSLLTAFDATVTGLAVGGLLCCLSTAQKVV